MNFSDFHGNSAADEDEIDLLCGMASQRCPICAKTSGLSRCGDCKVVSYCGAAHQTADRRNHKKVCVDIKKTRQDLEREEAALRTAPADFTMPADVFNTAVGRFWGIFGTRDYMRARFSAADALLKASTKVALEQALAHFTDMLRLCRSDNLGVRDAVPSILLRLGRDQECYDFLKWWALADPDGKYDWGDMSLPYLNIRGADVFEPVDAFRKGNTSLSHLVTLTLLKLRLRLELQAFEPEFGFGSGGLARPHRPVGSLVRSRIKTLRAQQIPGKISVLQKQYDTLCRLVNDANPHFWDALVDESQGAPTPPPYYSHGSVEEAQLTLCQCKQAWEESEDAIVMIEADTASFLAPYRSPAAVAGVGGTRSMAPEETRNLEKRRGVGDAFPSLFKPPLPTSSPSDLFTAARAGHGGNVRFVSTADKKIVLVSADGACPNNGQSSPQGGWAVLYGPTDIASGRLELKGPFGAEAVATSNRAELRAVIAALRLCDWRGDGFNSIVIATDSAYVVDGATGWTKGWVRNGWKTRTGDVKNRDLWELLLGEVERWKYQGLDVALWRIPRELNTLADGAAREAAETGPPVPVFRDPVIGVTPATASGSTTNAGTRPAARILTLCLDYEDLFNSVYGGLISKITSKAKMERATTADDALYMLDQSPPPTHILIADAALARHRRVWERVIDCIHGGATVVLAGCFSSMVTMGQFDRFFTRVGLSWKRGEYGREDTKLHRDVVGSHLASRLPSVYSQKASFVKGVDSSEAWYTAAGEAAVAFASVGAGKLGYIGDVNGEEGSDAVVLAMFGLLV